MSQTLILKTTTTVTTEAVELKPRISIEEWGADHWSTFAYIETRCVDYNGEPNIQHMRCDGDRHPQFDHMTRMTGESGKYPTRFKTGELPDHDDWDCLDDCELLGLLENKGTGLHRVYKLTALGKLVAGQLRSHKMNKGTFATFTPVL